MIKIPITPWHIHYNLCQEIFLDELRLFEKIRAQGFNVEAELAPYDQQLGFAKSRHCVVFEDEAEAAIFKLTYSYATDYL